MKDAVKTKMSLYCLTVDISGAFDNIVHSQALFSLASSGVNPPYYVYCLLGIQSLKFKLPEMVKYLTW